MLSAKERMLQFIGYQKELVTIFCKKNKLSKSYFMQKGAIGSDKLALVLNNYTELNADWVITGRGEMLLKATVPEVKDNGQIVELQKELHEIRAQANEWKDKYYKCLEDYNECLKEKRIFNATDFGTKKQKSGKIN